MKFHKAVWLVMTVVLFTAWAAVAWAGDADETDVITGAKSTDFIKERSYIGVVGISADIDQWGDFNGTHSFIFQAPATANGGVTTTPYAELDFVPSITRQFGWGVMLGHREGPWAAEVSFWRSDHTATFYFAGPVTVTTPASLQAINIDFKRYFFTSLPTQPFINIGISFPWLWVRGLSFLEDSTNSYAVVGVDDETFSGVGLNLGAGVELYLDNNFSILAGVYQRWGEFDQINGAAKVPLNQMQFDHNPSSTGALAGDGLNLYVGTTFGVE